MDDHVKTRLSSRRAYRSPRRAQQAAQTRLAILESARELFVLGGYTATTVADIAAGAEVSVDTVYATVGRKPALLRELVETAISGTDQAVPAEQRDYVRRIRFAAGAAEKLTIYAHAIAEIQQRLAPVSPCSAGCAVTDPDCVTLWGEISRRRAANMLLLAGDLRSTGEVRADLSDEQVADIIWTMNSAEYWVLLVRERAWSSEQFASWLSDAWIRLLLDRSR